MAIWEQLFKKWGVTPLRVYYEQMCRRPRGVVGAIKAHLGVAHDPAARISLPLIVRQADRTTDEWRARFVDDAASNTDSLAACSDSKENPPCGGFEDESNRFRITAAPCPG
jgi:LPS sulfotransferase NodH